MDENNRQPFEEENTEAASEAPEAAPETAEPKPEELLGEEFIFLGSHATQKEEKITRIEKATKPKKRKKKKGCLRGLVYFSVILAVSVALALVIFRWAGDYLGLMKPDREVDVTIAKGSSTKQIAETLKENEAITQVYRVTGKNKLHVHAVAASSEEMEKLIREVIDPLPGVVSCSCNIILSRIKDIKGLRL